MLFEFPLLLLVFPVPLGLAEFGVLLVQGLAFFLLLLVRGVDFRVQIRDLLADRRFVKLPDLVLDLLGLVHRISRFHHRAGLCQGNGANDDK